MRPGSIPTKTVFTTFLRSLSGKIPSKRRFLVPTELDTVYITHGVSRCGEPRTLTGGKTMSDANTMTAPVEEGKAAETPAEKIARKVREKKAEATEAKVTPKAKAADKGKGPKAKAKDAKATDKKAADAPKAKAEKRTEKKAEKAPSAADEIRTKVVKALRELKARSVDSGRDLNKVAEKAGLTRADVYFAINGGSGKAGSSPACLAAKGVAATHREEGVGLVAYLVATEK